MNRIKKWFRRRILKLEYFIGADYGIGDYSAIILVLVNHKTGKFEVISQRYCEPHYPYLDFYNQVKVIAKQYNVTNPLIDGLKY